MAETLFKLLNIFIKFKLLKIFHIYHSSFLLKLGKQTYLISGIEASNVKSNLDFMVFEDTIVKSMLAKTTPPKLFI